MTYTITLNDNQLRVLQHAVEVWERTMMGQFWDYTEELAMATHDYWNKDGEINNVEFDLYIKDRDGAKYMMEAAYKRCCGWKSLQQKTDDMLTAEDMWTAMRYKMWQDRPEPKSHDTVDGRPPLHLGGEPPIKITAEVEE